MYAMIQEAQPSQPMTEQEPRRRRYSSLRRAAQAHQTKAEIAGAARRLFVSQGWAATTVRDVAREAGVSVPTVYAAYQNKTGLIWALADAADMSAGLPQAIDELEATAGPAAHLAAMTGYDRRLFERAGDLITMIREAGRTEPDLADLYTQGRRKADQVRVQVSHPGPAAPSAGAWTSRRPSTSTPPCATSTSTPPSPSNDPGPPTASNTGGPKHSRAKS